MNWLCDEWKWAISQNPLLRYNTANLPSFDALCQAIVTVMLTLRQHLAQLDPALLRVIAQNQGMTEEKRADGDLLGALVQEMLQPEHVREVWAELPEAARQALQALAQQDVGMPVAAFQRRFGELRRIGPGRLLTEQPWREPVGPAETLWYLGWLVRAFHTTPEGTIDYISLPDDLLPLLPLPALQEAPQPSLPSPLPPPATVREMGELLLDDLGTILAYVQNQSVWLRGDGRWRISDLKQLTPRLRLSSIRKQPLETGGPLHLIFAAAKHLRLLEPRKRRQRFGQALRPWLEQSRSQQMASLFEFWRTSEDWNDLCLTPGLRCQEGAWQNDPVLARKALLTQLARVSPGQWFGLDDFVAMIYEHQPDFQRPDGRYDTWYIQNATGEFLRGFEHWPAVEGRLIRSLWQGPLFWLGVVALDEAGETWSLTEQGQRLLQGALPDVDASGPVLTVERDFTLILAPHIGLWDRLRVALFAFWQASDPEYRYLITRRGLQRAARHGVTTQQIISFLERASGEALPGNVRKALEHFRP